MAVYHLIIASLDIDANVVLEEAKKSVDKQTYPQKCKEIIKIIEGKL